MLFWRIVNGMKDINSKIGHTVESYGKPVAFKLMCVAIGFANSILINRCLGVALRGEYTLITNWASLIQLFLNLGIGAAYPAFKKHNPQNGKRVFSTVAFVISLVYSSIIVFIVPFFSSRIQYVLLLAIISAIENIIIYIAIVEDVAKRNAINILTSIVHTIILAGIFVLLKQNLDAIMIAVLLNHLMLCVSIVVLYRIGSFDIRQINFSVLKEIFSIAIPSMLMNLLMYLNYHADILCLGYLIDDSVQIGLYGTAVTLGNMLWIIPDAFKDVIFNRATKRDNPKEILLAIAFNFLLCCIVLVGFVFLGKPFLSLMYGPDYVPAYPLVLLMFLGTLPMILYKLIHPIYITNGHPGVVVCLLGLAVIINIIGNFIFIPRFEGVGAAVSSVISYSICGIAFFVKFIKDYKRKEEEDE